MSEALQHNMLYSGVHKQHRASEQFATDHALSCVLTGELHLSSNNGTLIAKPGTIYLFRKNQLVKATKIPAPDGTPCTTLTIFISDPILRKYATENNIHIDHKYAGAPVIDLSGNKFIKGYFDSLHP